MSIEDELRDSLRHRAASVDVQPDLDDVSARGASRDRRTRRFLTAGLVVALIAGPLAGFAIGSARDDGGGDVAIGTGADGQEIAMGAGDVSRSSAAFGSGMPLERLFLRTSADGVEIRAYRSSPIAADRPLPATCEPGTECPTAPECFDTFEPPLITGELSTEAAVTVATGTVGATSGSDPDLAVSTGNWGAFGVEEAAPARWVIASVNESVVRVRATFPGGTTDEMEPVDGVVVLASQVADPNAGGGALEGLAADGSVVQWIDLTPGSGAMANASTSDLPGAFSGSAESRAVLRLESSSNAGDGSSSASSSVSGSTGSAGICAPVPVPMPQQPLPEPGEQPTDPAAARAAVELAYSISYDGTKSPEEKAQYQDGPTGITPEQIAGSGYGDQVSDASGKVTDVVFTSPTTASVRYDIAVANWVNQFPGRVGEAVLVDGTWKVARATICNDLSLAGAVCPPAK